MAMAMKQLSVTQTRRTQQFRRLHLGQQEHIYLSLGGSTDLNDVIPDKLKRNTSI